MRALLDNTSVNLVGEVLRASPETEISPAGALALFDLAEHIIFDEVIVISNAPGSPTFGPTMQVIDELGSLGVHDKLVQVQAFDLEKHHTAACETAAARISNLLDVQSAWAELKRWGKDALEGQRTIPAGVYDFGRFLQLGSIDCSLTELAREHGSVPVAEAEYVTRCFGPLRAQLQYHFRHSGGFPVHVTGALSALTRLYVNEALSRAMTGVYTPAPHRAKLADQANGLVRRTMKSSYRFKVSDAVARVLREHSVDYVIPLLEELDALSSFPLPLLTLHLLRERSRQLQLTPRGPGEILQLALSARESSEAQQMRRNLTEWEVKLARSPDEAGATAARIKIVERELTADLDPDRKGTKKRSSLNFTVKLFPSPAIEASLEGLLARFPDLRRILVSGRRHALQRQFLASVAKTFRDKEGDLDVWLKQALNRNVANSRRTRGA